MAAAVSILYFIVTIILIYFLIDFRKMEQKANFKIWVFEVIVAYNIITTFLESIYYNSFGLMLANVIGNLVLAVYIVLFFRHVIYPLCGMETKPNSISSRLARFAAILGPHPPKPPRA